MEAFVWFFLMALSWTVLAQVIVLHVRLYKKWRVIALEGARRKEFVGVNRVTGDGVVLPDWKEEGQSKATYFLDSDLIQFYAVVDPDRDEVWLKVIVTMQGSPESSDDKVTDRIVIIWRVAWSVPHLVPFHDLPDEPGDHGDLPKNLRVSRIEVENYDQRIVDRFDRILGQAGRPYRRRFFANGVESYLPGAAVIAFMNNHKEGEHLERLYEVVARQSRELLRGFDVRDFMRMERDIIDLPFDSFKIRGVRVELSDDMKQPIRRGDLEARLSEIMTLAAQLELESFGVFVNEINFRAIQLPTRLVEASRNREAASQDAPRMEVITTQMKENVRDLKKIGMDADIAAWIAADLIASDSRPGPVGLLYTLFRK